MRWKFYIVTQGVHVYGKGLTSQLMVILGYGIFWTSGHVDCRRWTIFFLFALSNWLVLQRVSIGCEANKAVANWSWAQKRQTIVGVRSWPNCLQERHWILFVYWKWPPRLPLLWSPLLLNALILIVDFFFSWWLRKKIPISNKSNWLWSSTINHWRQRVRSVDCTKEADRKLIVWLAW